MTRARRHAALADVARLAVVDALALGDRSPGELQAALDLPSNLMAHHLKVLESAGTVTRRRSEGDRRRTYLTLTDRIAVDRVSPSIDAARVVFVCTANSARSQLAAAMWAGVSDVPAASAGTQPADRVAPGAVAAAERHDLRLLGGDPRPFAGLSADGDLVVAVCDNAYEELGSAIDLHWSIPDPVRAGDDEAFDAAYDELDRRVAVLAPLVSIS
ncbi:helix-turn-helix domain-containing protein [Aeromicrobium endophyticum]|uniref:arsenate reductase/protein-tyrosine-phosphatase family protein n=1 Tax=Aeromicrobium endophyticum TaxID=2292704 RepID=UPI001F43A842|nr:helix-turn-helix domain-containing protein [Aeromicrobium endophyticum]